ncbi:MAG: hypothetical protein H7222_03220 [Methylotenera sp.]|nr:hypothetical protein [Oligoflexia bacterium]
MNYRGNPHPVISIFLISLLASSGCSKSEPTGSSSAQLAGSGGATFLGRASAGPISNGQVSAYPLHSDGTVGNLAGTAKTDANGNFILNVAGGTDVSQLKIVVSGGSYRDELTGHLLTNTVMTAVIAAKISDAKGTSEIAVSPATEWAGKSLLATHDLSPAKIEAMNKSIGAALGLGSVDVTKVRPASPYIALGKQNLTSTSIEAKYALALAALSKLANGRTSGELVDELRSLHNDDGSPKAIGDSMNLKMAQAKQDIISDSSIVSQLAATAAADTAGLAQLKAKAAEQAAAQIIVQANYEVSAAGKAANAAEAARQAAVQAALKAAADAAKAAADQAAADKAAADKAAADAAAGNGKGGTGTREIVGTGTLNISDFFPASEIVGFMDVQKQDENITDIKFSNSKGSELQDLITLTSNGEFLGDAQLSVTVIDSKMATRTEIIQVKFVKQLSGSTVGIYDASVEITDSVIVDATLIFSASGKVLGFGKVGESVEGVTIGELAKSEGSELDNLLGLSLDPEALTDRTLHLTVIDEKGEEHEASITLMRIQDKK